MEPEPECVPPGAGPLGDDTCLFVLTQQGASNTGIYVLLFLYPCCLAEIRRTVSEHQVD